VSAAVLPLAAAALDQTLGERDAHARQVARLLEAIGLATGIELSTSPDDRSVAEALRVLDSLTSPADEADGWYWADAAEGDRSGPFATEGALARDVADYADELPRGHLVVRARDGRLGAAMYVPPGRAN
jgi:hypothetical protein